MDNEIKNTNNQSLKIQLSLASLMFFSPFITHLLKESDFELNNQDRLFIDGYISFGWINIGLLALALVSWLTSYFYTLPVVTTIYHIIIWILVLLLVIWCIGVITETKIITSSSFTQSSIEYSNPDKTHTLLSYIPWYSIYLRYTNHNFDTPDLLIKESLIVWIIFGISCFIPNPVFAIIIAIAILIRIVSLLANINIIPKPISDFLSSLFYKNPEEIWGYVWWSIIFIFQGNYNRPYWKFLVDTTKKEYQYLYDIKKFGTIQRQYVLLLVGIVLLLWQVDLWHISWLVILTILLILWRYVIMLSVRGRSPALPLMRELVAVINAIIQPFISKK